MLTLEQAIEKLNAEYRPVTMAQAIRNMYWIMKDEVKNDKRRDSNIE